VVLAGPGVVRDGAVPGLHALATSGWLGVLNTWGAKGVFDWRSVHHWATVGLQADDFTLGGLADADLVIATGLDPDESPFTRLGPAPILEVAPGALDPLAAVWQRPREPLAMPPLRDRLAAVTQRGWAADGVPPPPTRLTLNYSRALPPGGLLAADPGVAGYWVARTFSTTELGSVAVPGRPGTVGFAAAAVLAARLRQPGRPALAVVDDPDAPQLHAVLDVAARLGVPVGVEAWRPDAPPAGAEDHLAGLGALFTPERTEVRAVRTDPAQLAEMIEAAGPIIAWRGPSSR
jgi:acetolactate synthase-1/2/3 large subunit